MKTCIMLHLKNIQTEKGFCPITAKMLIFTWGVFASCRRILGIVCMFLPSMGLFSILHHFDAEQIPFKVRLDYAKKFNITPTDKISLHGLNVTRYWSDLDRWDYSDPNNPTAPPSYSIYTGSTLEETFVAFIILSVVQICSLFLVKALTSEDFRRKGHYTNKMIDLVLNTNFSHPYKDWDDGLHSVAEYRQRYRATCREMAWTLATNIVFSLMMMVPVWYTGIIHTYTRSLMYT